MGDALGACSGAHELHSGREAWLAGHAAHAMARREAAASGVRARGGLPEESV